MTSPNRQTAAPRARTARDSRKRALPTYGIPQDDNTIKAGLDIELVRPSFEDGYMMCRLLPMICAEDPSKFDPFRLSSESRHYGDTLINVPVVRYVGSTNPSSFILYDPRDMDAGYKPDRENPYLIAYKALRYAHKNGKSRNGRRWNAEWNPLIDPASKEKIWKSATTNWYAHAEVYVNGDKDYLKENNGEPLGRSGRPTIIQGSGSVGEAICKMFDIPREGYNGDPEDFAKAFKYGDPLGVVNGELVGPGRFIYIYVPSVSRMFEKSQFTSVAERVTHVDEKDSNFESYAIAVAASFKHGGVQYTPEIPADAADRIIHEHFNAWFWDDILRYPSPEELCVMIARAFSNQAAMLKLAWDDHPDFFSEEVIGILRQRVTAAVPGAARDAAQAGSQPGDDYQPPDVEDLSLDETGDYVDDGGEGSLDGLDPTMEGAAEALDDGFVDNGMEASPDELGGELPADEEGSVDELSEDFQAGSAEGVDDFSMPGEEGEVITTDAADIDDLLEAEAPVDDDTFIGNDDPTQASGNVTARVAQQAQTVQQQKAAAQQQRRPTANPAATARAAAPAAAKPAAAKPAAAKPAVAKPSAKPVPGKPAAGTRTVPRTGATAAKPAAKPTTAGKSAPAAAKPGARRPAPGNGRGRG